MISEIFNVRRWGVIWIVGVVTLAVVKKNQNVKILLGLVLAQLAIYFVIYLSTPIPPADHIAGSFDRLLLHLMPIFIYAMALSCQNLVGFKKLIK
jgi:hypothetical protein